MMCGSLRADIAPDCADFWAAVWSMVFSQSWFALTRSHSPWNSCASMPYLTLKSGILQCFSPQDARLLYFFGAFIFTSNYVMNSPGALPSFPQNKSCAQFFPFFLQIVCLFLIALKDPVSTYLAIRLGSPYPNQASYWWPRRWEPSPIYSPNRPPSLTPQLKRLSSHHGNVPFIRYPTTC